MRLKRKVKADYDIRVGEIIRLYRKRIGMTQGDLATIVGVSTATIANYENGSTVPDARKIFLIGETLGIPNIFSFCEASDDIRLNLYRVGDKIEISEDGYILCEKNEISAEIFKLYGCTDFRFFCIEQKENVYFMTNTETVEAGECALVRFLGDDYFSIAEFDGEVYTDINTKRREEKVTFIAAKVLDVLKDFQKIEYAEHKYEIPLI